MTPNQQYARYRNKNANPASTPDSQLARRVEWMRKQYVRQSEVAREHRKLAGPPPPKPLPFDRLVALRGRQAKRR